MKRILLTTTSLILAAGFAHADVTFSGKGEVGIYQDEAANTAAVSEAGSQAAADTAGTSRSTVMTVYSGYDLNVAVSGASDNGITFSMGFDMGAGMLADRDDDYAMDAQGATIGTSALTIGYAGVTIVAGQDKIDDLYSDSQNGDVSISGAFGDLSFSVVADTDSGQNANSMSLSGAAGDMSWGFVTTDDNGSVTSDSASKVTVGYTVSDALSMSFKHDTKGAATAINTIGATLTMGSLTLGLSADDNNDNDISVGYAAGPLSAAYASNENDEWKFNTSYDLGGGASAFASVDHSEFTVLGMSFAF
jgi:hypothetical protein